MSGRILVTGSEGFVGKTLCRYLTEQGYQVYGCDIHVSPDVADRRSCNITDPIAIANVLDWCGTLEYVIHLAAISFVPEAAENPAKVMEINLNGSINLMATLQQRTPETRLLLIGSSESYGIPQSLPLTEDHPMHAANPYAISKAAADLYGAYLHKTTGANIVRLRPFNHSGPGQSDRFVLSSFARQIAEIEAGLIPPVLRTGNLDVARDFSHVDDIIGGYEVALRKGKIGEAYNLCSGKAESLQGALDTFLQLSTTAISIEKDPDRMRKAEVPEIRGSHEKFSNDTGWQPAIPFTKLLESLLEYWRSEISVKH